jgi:hypothetical protein
MSDIEKVMIEFVHQAGEVFDLEQFQMDDVVVEPREETAFCTMTVAEVAHVDSDTMYCFCLIPAETEFNQTLVENFFDHFRTVEDHFTEDFVGMCVMWKKLNSDEFWYMWRADTGAIGLFHSVLSMDVYEDIEEQEPDAGDDA